MNVLKFAKDSFQKQVNMQTALIFGFVYSLLLLLVGFGLYNYFIFPFEIRSALEHRLELSEQQASEAEQVGATMDYGWSLYQKYLFTKDRDLLSQAESQYKRALEMDPSNIAAKYNTALVLKEKGEIESAIDIVSGIVSERPRHYLARFLLGQLYIDKGDYTKAEQELKTTISVESGLANVYAELGLVYEKQGNQTQAIEVYKQALRYNPEEEKAVKRLKELGVSPK